jgi:hypothetical protein
MAVFRTAVGIFLIVCASHALAQAVPATLRTRPAAQALFERDWVLMNWALRYYDVNGDILLEPEEAQAAADMFRKMADTNRDGRITPQEYAAARQQILERD